jgi:lysophospholipase L1-like esterase
MRILPFLATCTAVLAATVLFFSPQTSRAEILVKDGESIAFMGDSITQFGADQDGGYVRLVEGGLADQGIKVTVIPAGWSGNTSKHMLGRLENAVLNKKPTWMTLSAGVNDVMHTAVELEEYKTNITAILDRAQQAGVKVMILTATQIGLPVTSPGNVKLAGYNAFLHETAKARNLPLADLNAAMVAEQAVYEKAKAERSLTGDGVHMNIYGNMVMARGVLAAFGLNEAQLAALQTKWNKRPDVYPLPNGPTPRGTGTGLTGEYFSDVNFTTLVKTQVDGKLYNFLWGKGSPTNTDRTPMIGMPSDNFSVRWTGQIQALEEGIYGFGISADETVKVWIGDLGGDPLLNKTATRADSKTKGTFKMAAGQKYDIKVEYIDTTGDAEIQFHWTRPGLTGGIVPQSQLYPAAARPTATAAG